ncbi:helix-turn-helix transcriptional regulator [Epilithonimonas sp.]|uniref:helix-turn-helix domain-containing protein n=1 Tax=Epilithonimonas sp. TaxID=2894511 RepID=UPI0028A07445|nr:helix-turn-helix transcriptional regulator [Epilithonimonas sp.]
MQYENRNVEELLKYYSKISPYESKILNIKFLFLKGDYEEALTELFSLKNIAEVDKDSEKFFQYQCLYGQVCQTLGLKTELAVVRKNLKDSKYLKGGAFAELALDNSSFEIFTLDERLAILRSVIKNDKGKNNDASLIQANIWLAEILGKDNQESKIALDSALSLINKSDSDIYYKILADNYIAKIYLKRNNARAAFDLLKKYQNSAVYLSNAGLKVDFFKNLAISSASVGEFANLDHINRYYFKIVEDQNAKRAVARAKLVNHINKANEEKLESQNDLFRNICIVIFLFLICAIAIYYFYRIKKKRAEVSVTEEEDPKSFVIPDKTEKRILSKLEEFEKSQKYIQKKVSLKMLAQQFDTNPTYLSEIINKHKNSNFNSYINNLRIDYIVDKINENLEYRKYKVSYLADECGFSSHSLFTTVFKSRMNVSPTEFLQKLNE